jgi:hypothetical protein
MYHLKALYPQPYFKPNVQKMVHWLIFSCLLILILPLSAQKPIELYNRYQKGSLQMVNGKPTLSTKGNNAIWMIEKIANSAEVRIKHLPTGGYLHAETNAQIPTIGTIQPGWESARWLIEETDETFYRIKNKWRGTYLRNETGIVELGESQPGWWGGQWLYMSPASMTATTTANPPTGRLKVRGVYIVPSGQQEKPGAKAAIASILAMMQWHFLQQIGVTFEYEPEVAVIRTNADTPSASTLDMALELGKKALNKDYEGNKNILFTVVEGGLGGPAFGTPGMVRMPQSFWGDVYNTYLNRPNTLATTLAGWSHELGHALGLEHTGESTKPCLLKNYRVDMGTLPSLLMQQSKAFPVVYDYPFHKDEIKMLLDSTYCQECLIERGQRPAAVRYLRARQVQANKLATAGNVTMLEYYSSGGGKGAFVKQSNGEWKETDLLGKANFTFKEVRRDQAAVYLEDASRNMAITLNLTTRTVLYNLINQGKPQPLYSILWAKGG